MGKLLVHIITGVENPSRSVLGFLVAKSAIEDGNEVTIFCAGDGVTSLHDITTKEMQGVGLGTLSDHLEELKLKGAVLYASGKSAQARGITKDQLESLGFTNKKLIDENGTYIIVKSCNISYMKSALLEDNLEIKSNIKEITKTSFFMSQKVFKDNDQITEAAVHLVTIDKKGKPVKIPETLKVELEKLI